MFLYTSEAVDQYLRSKGTSDEAIKNAHNLLTQYSATQLQSLPTLPFGKHRGKTAVEVMKCDGGMNYLVWFLKTLEDPERSSEYDNSELISTIRHVLGQGQK